MKPEKHIDRVMSIEGHALLSIPLWVSLVSQTIKGRGWLVRTYRQLFVRAIIFMSAVLAAWPLLADAETVNGITWTYKISGGKAEIFNNYNSAISSSTIGAITIPSTLGGYAVTRIGEGAFVGCCGLTSVTMPTNLTSIGDSAFEYCSGLTHITIPNGITSIGDYVFCGCSGLTSFSIPNSVTSIGCSAFEECENLIDMTMPASVTEVGWRAFGDCSNLARVVIGNGVMNIEGGVFENCDSLTNISVGSDNVAYKSVDGLLLTKDGAVLLEGINGAVTIPNSVTNIGEGAFFGRRGLKRVVLPNSVTHIGRDAFCDCVSLTDLNIPDNVSDIEIGAFSGCGGLTNILVGSENGDYKSVNGLLLTKDGSDLIRGINGSVVIPDGVTRIGEYAFDGCLGLTSVLIPDSVTSIEEEAFCGCHGITSVIIPRGVIRIEESAFSSCGGIVQFSVDEGNDAYKSIGGLLLTKNDGDLIRGLCGAVTIPDGVKRIGKYAFDGCFGLTSVEIPGSVTNIDEFAFEDCSGLANVSMPQRLSNIGAYAFWGCSGLTSVDIPDGVMHIGDYAFKDCTNMVNATIPVGIVNIGEGTFAGCGRLGNVTVPSGVVSMESGAFFQCSGLTNVTMLGDAPSVGILCFFGCSSDCTVYVRRDSSGWGVNIPGMWNGVRITYMPGDDSPSQTTYTVTYKPGNYGTGPQQSETKTNDVLLTLCVAIFTRTGYTQTGWATSDGGSMAYDLGATYTANTSVTLYPVWVSNTYSVTLDCQGGNGGSADVVATYDSEMPTVAVPTRDGYTFGGYWTGIGGSDVQYYTSSGVSARTWDITSPATLYAYWIKGSPTETSYTIVFHSNYPSDEKEIGWDFDYVISASLPTISELGWARQDYDFKGWATNLIDAADGNIWKDDGEFVCSAIASGETLDVYAVWRLKDGCSATETVNGVPWTYSVSGGEVTICSASKTEYPSGVIVSPSGVITIPSVLGGCPVTSIGDMAFYECRKLTSVIIPDSVTSIGDSAFKYCMGIDGLTGLTNVTIGAGVLNIGNAAFSYCRDLVSVTLPDGLTNIGSQVFYECSGLASVMIPNSVTSIDGDAFRGCSSLTSVTIPDSVQCIGGQSFYDCRGLVSVTIGTGVTNLSPDAFSCCGKLELFSVAEDNLAYKSDSGLLLSKDGKTLVCGVNGDVTIPDGVMCIGQDSFSGHGGLISITMPETVMNIEPYAFRRCNGLASVTIPVGVQCIGDWAFEQCNGLTNVVISGTVTSIGSYAFSGCNDLLFDTATIQGVKLVDGWAVGYVGAPSGTIDLTGIRGIGDSAFYGCNGLTSVIISDGVTRIGNDVFENCRCITNVVISDSVKSIARSAFYGCDGLVLDTNTIPGVELLDGWVVGYTDSLFGDVVLPEVRGIQDGAFDRCWRISSVTIGGDVKYIGPATFFLCSNLRSVTIPDGVISIGDNAFYWSGLTSVTIPGSVTSIGAGAFEKTSLREVNIPASVTSIGQGAFLDCGVLKSFVVADDNPSYKSKDGLLLSADGKTIVCGINGSVIIPDSVTNIGSCAFWGYETLTSIIMPDSVASIGNKAFYACSGLTNVTFGNGVMSIGDNAFSYCRGLTSMTIPNSVKSIGADAFRHCDQLMSVIVPDNVESLGNGAFGNCSELTHAMIGNGVERVGDYMFWMCSKLTSVVIGSNVTDVGECVFGWCNSLTNVTMLSNAPSVAGYCVNGYCFSECHGDCTVYVRRGSTGWGVDIPGTWNGVKIEYMADAPMMSIADDALPEAVTNAIEAAGFVDMDAVKAAIGGSAAEYMAFKSWANGVKSVTGAALAGEAAVVSSSHAAAAYLLGAERLFENAPVIKFDEIKVEDGASQMSVAMVVSVRVRDGDDVVKCSASKVATMFEATSDLGDWNGDAKLTPMVIVEEGDGETMRFRVTPGVGTADRAFLRIRK